MIKVGIVGISGYSGELILKLLLNHPQVRVTYASAGTSKGKVADILPSLRGKTNILCEAFDAKKAADLCDVLFLAVPHTTAMSLVPQLLKAKKRVIDLSADYRLKSAQVYKKWYTASHLDKGNLSKAVYGLPELYRENIKKAQLVANPGCYPTAAILALAPLAAIHANSIKSIIIDAKSGVTGAGKKAVAALMYPEVSENLKAYKVLAHQHTPEITQTLSNLAEKPVDVAFVAHLIPMNRGILETIYVQFSAISALKNIQQLYKKFYKTEHFVRVLEPGMQPETKHVFATNYCDIGLAVDVERKLLVITSAIDNLMKGASGQAVQNMNIMCGLKEMLGLL